VVSDFLSVIFGFSRRAICNDCCGGSKGIFYNRI